MIRKSASKVEGMCLVAVVLAIALTVASRLQPTVKTAMNSTPARVSQLSNLPLYFIENKGQLDDQIEHRNWYVERFGDIRPDWYLFPFGRANHLDPAQPITSLKTVWKNVKRNAGVCGR